MKSGLLAALLCAFSSVVPAFGAGAPEAVRVREIRITGLDGTVSKVIRRELEIHEGDVYTPESFEETLARIRNLRIFRQVEGEVHPAGAGRVDLEIRLREKWTTVMVFRPAVGGGSRFLAVGAYDPNIFGRYLEAGGQYEYLDGKSSGRVWFRDPRLLDRRIGLLVEAGVERQVARYYQGGGLTGTLQTRATLLRSRLEFEIHSHLRSGILSEYYHDGLESASGLLPPGEAASGATVLIGGYVEVGRLDFVRDYMERGSLLEAEAAFSSPGWGSGRGFGRFAAEARRFWIIDNAWNIGMRGAAGWTNSPLHQYRYRIGGLSGIRALRVGQFGGNGFLAGNFELRRASIRNSWLIAQHVVFADTGITERNPLFGAVGVGLRLMSPRVYRLNLRMDYAWPLDGRGVRGFFFGLQQFF